MTEIIRYSRLGEEDLRFGLGTFEVRLADGRVVLLSEIDIGALLNDAARSTQVLTLDTITISGGQIGFPSTQAASSGANTLDDYEEGAWTPSVGGTATYTTQTGFYTKKGREVTASCSLTINSIGSGSTSIISGLPFANVSDFATCAVYWSGTSASLVACMGLAAAGTTITLVSATAAATGLSANAVLTDSTTIRFTLTYFAAT